MEKQSEVLAEAYQKGLRDGHSRGHDEGYNEGRNVGTLNAKTMALEAIKAVSAKKMNDVFWDGYDSRDEATWEAGMEKVRELFIKAVM